MAKDKMLKITLVHGSIGEKPKTKGALRTLGLRNIDQTTERPDSADLRGVLAQVAHLVEIEDV
ncbi:MAG TPA: 50S ribosomal protein L30 [Acidimicrobiia bacterium]|uniref:Large ribosomal subunit protein uL30 n=1 Tax=uncultured actinobacterium Rifle_16ft_4_minimus_9892 TaxID=1665150 RepID=A0A0H4TVU9_9ACTN|nr:RpmD, 50S ribosomal protein L30/L7E, large subunit ribosomal protein L30 [uncultured actinobacterium Rifle_16ft_4_minimus_9892]HLA65899.1 50S ribosomal protein L30 [Acidimicrobiia bacterium]